MVVKKKTSIKKANPKKTSVKKAVSKKTSIKKAAVKKTAVVKKTVSKKASVKKVSAKKTPVKKVSPKKTPKTTPKTTKKTKSSKSASNKSISKKQSTKKTVLKKAKVKNIKVKKTTKKLSFTTDLFSYDELSNSKEEMALTKYDIGAHTTYAEYAYDPMKTDEPPSVYYIDRVVLLPVDPKFAFMYWELREDTLNYFLGMHGYDSKLVLRVYDVTNIDFNGYNAHEYWDVEIYNRVGTWYLKHYRGDRSLALDIGLLSSDGAFHAISRSKSIYFPRDKMVDPGKVLWMLVDEFGNKVISEIEDYSEEDLILLKKILGEDRFNIFLKGGFDIFLGGSAWGRLPIIEDFLDLSKMPSSPGRSSRG
jgi:hypothetical protein